MDTNFSNSLNRKCSTLKAVQQCSGLPLDKKIKINSAFGGEWYWKLSAAFPQHSTKKLKKAKKKMQAVHYLKCLVWVPCRIMKSKRHFWKVLWNLKTLFFDCSSYISISFIFLISHLSLIHHNMLMHFCSLLDYSHHGGYSPYYPYYDRRFKNIPGGLLDDRRMR